jgi:hypothetical protein
MRSRFGRHQTRHIAAVMLFVWLFAVAASWANACILLPESSSDHHARGGFIVPHGSSDEDTAGASGPHEADPVLQACASFCETEQNIVTKAQSAKADGAAEQAALVARVFACWPAFMPGQAEVRWRALAAPPPPGPPVAIAFLRLTI